MKLFCGALNICSKSLYSSTVQSITLVITGHVNLILQASKTKIWQQQPARTIRNRTEQDCGSIDNFCKPSCCSDDAGYEQKRVQSGKMIKKNNSQCSVAQWSA